MTDPAAIAASLSEGERKALTRHHPTGFYGSMDFGWPEPARDPTSFCAAGRGLMDKELIAWHPDKKDSRTRVTPLGRAVRAHLKENSNAS